MVAAKCGLPKDLADSQPAAHFNHWRPNIHLCIPHSSQEHAVRFVSDSVLGAHLSVHVCVCTVYPPAEDEEGVHLWVHLWESLFYLSSSHTLLMEDTPNSTTTLQYYSECIDPKYSIKTPNPLKVMK